MYGTCLSSACVLHRLLVLGFFLAFREDGLELETLLPGLSSAPPGFRAILFSLLPDRSNGHESEPKAPVRLVCLLDSTARSPPPSLLHRKQHLLRQVFFPLGSLSLCSSGCPGTGYLKTRTHTDPLASASQVLDLKVGATMLSMLRLLGAAGSADGVKVVPP